MEKYYYKASLQVYPKMDFIVEKISEDDAYAKTSGYYGYSTKNEYTNEQSSGTYAIRRTKKSAINALKKVLTDDIKKMETEINDRKVILNKFFT